MHIVLPHHQNQILQGVDNLHEIYQLEKNSTLKKTLSKQQPRLKLFKLTEFLLQL